MRIEKKDSDETIYEITGNDVLQRNVALRHETSWRLVTTPETARYAKHRGVRHGRAVIKEVRSIKDHDQSCNRDNHLCRNQPASLSELGSEDEKTKQWQNYKGRQRHHREFCRQRQPGTESNI